MTLYDVYGCPECPFMGQKSLFIEEKMYRDGRWTPYFRCPQCRKQFRFPEFIQGPSNDDNGEEQADE